jgi:serine protease Do
MKHGRALLMVAGAAALAVAAVTYAESGSSPTPAPRVNKKVVIFRSGGSWLGVQIADVDSDRARELGMKEEYGAEIQSVSPGSPAEEAGLLKGDVITDYQGTRIEGVSQLTRLVRETPAGRSASVKIFRNGSPKTFQVKVGERNKGEAPDTMKHYEILKGDGDGDVQWYEGPEIPDIPEIPDVDLEQLEQLEHLDIPGLLTMHGIGGRPRLGAMVDDVGPQLAEYFGLKQDGGVLVKSVKKGSPGDTAGLKAGDVIIKVEDQAVEDVSDLHQALKERRDKDVRVTVVRDRREQTLTVPPLPEPERTTPKAKRSSGAPAEHHEEMQKQIQRALRQAEVARAAAGVETERVRQEVQRALQEHQEAIAEAAREAAALAAEQQAIEEEELGGGEEEIETPEAESDSVEVRQVSDEDRSAIRRAAEEARRIRTETQGSD